MIGLLVALVATACSSKSSTSEPPSATSPEPDATTPAADGSATAGDDATAGDAAQCRPTGCSATVCADEDVVTTCEFRPEYACYQKATCERQPDGQCGWTKSAELDACLANPPAQ
jgi:hypothetical protein